MPYSRTHKAQSRVRILESAVRLFTRKGFDHTSIDEVMADAKLTRGAFYAHFKSKQDLYAEAIMSSSTFSVLAQARPEGLADKAWLAQLLNAYLSPAHIHKADFPCPLAFLVTDVAVREPVSQQAYTDVYLKMNKIIHAYTRRFSCCDKETVMAVTTMMIGGVAVARALADQESQRQVLQSCQKMARQLLGVD